MKQLFSYIIPGPRKFMGDTKLFEIFEFFFYTHIVLKHLFMNHRPILTSISVGTANTTINWATSILKAFDALF